MQMHRVILAVLTILGLFRLGHAQDYAMGSDHGIVLVPLRYFCGQTDTAFTQDNADYTIRDNERMVSFRLFSTTLNVNGVHVHVPTPPILLQGVTYIPVRACADAFGATVDYQVNSTDESKIPQAQDASLVPPGKYAVVLHHGGQASSLYVHNTVQYLDLSAIEPGACAFSILSNGVGAFDQECSVFTPFAEDQFIAKDGRIIWARRERGSSFGNYVTPPKIITVQQTPLVAFSAYIAGVDYDLLRIDGNRVYNVLPPYTNAPLHLYLEPYYTAGVFLVRRSSQLITYQLESVNVETHAARYLFTWYTWSGSQFTRLRRQHSYRFIVDHQRTQEQRVFRQYHIAGEKIFDFTRVYTELPSRSQANRR